MYFHHDVALRSAWEDAVAIAETTLLSVTKMLVTPAVKKGVSEVRKWTVRRRVAKAASKQATAELGTQVTRKMIKDWLSREDVRIQLMAGSSEPVESALRDLEVRLPSAPPAVRRQSALTVLAAVCDQFMKAQPVTSAVVMASKQEKAHTTAEAQLTRDKIDSRFAELAQRAGAAEDFRENLLQLNDGRRGDALELQRSWPEIEDVVATIVKSHSRGDVVRQWARNEPSWYGSAPIDAYLWLAQTAHDYQQHEAAAKFIDDALNRGVHPRSFWFARKLAEVNFYDPDQAVAMARQWQPQVDDHPLLRCFIAQANENRPQAIQILRDWQPIGGQDRVTKLTALARLLVLIGQFQDGLAVALEAAEIAESPGALILAAQFLLSRSAMNEASDRQTDCDRATRLALRARDRRRQWHGDSVEPTIVAVKAFMRVGNLSRALELMQPPPVGEATQQEADDRRMRRLGAHVLSATRQTDKARDWVATAESEFAVAELTATEQTGQGDVDSSIATWTCAFGVANDDDERIAAALSLAYLGAPLPHLETLALTQPKAVEDIRLIHSTMSAANVWEALHTNAPRLEGLTAKLAEMYVEEGNDIAAADTLRSGGDRWHSPRLYLMAGERYWKAHETLKAIQALDSAIATGGPHWAGVAEAHRQLFDIRMATKKWDLATRHATELIRLDPADPLHHWAKAYALVNRGEEAAAWNALIVDGKLLQPDSAHRASLWVALAVRHDVTPGLISRFIKIFDQWPENEELGGQILALLFTVRFPEEIEPQEDEVRELHRAADRYVTRFPASRFFFRIQLPENDPLSQLAPYLQAHHNQLEAVEQAIQAAREANVPVGTVVKLFNRSYAEGLLQNFLGYVPCHPVRPEHTGVEAAASALGKAVAIDTSAACTLTLLEQSLRSALVSAFGQIRTTDWAYTDALRGRDSLALRSSGRAGWDPTRSMPTFVELNSSWVDELANRSQQLAQILRDATRESWPTIETISDIPVDERYLALVDMAASMDIALWCDEYNLRQIAEAYGVSCFDTTELLRHLASIGRLDQQVCKATEALLVHNFYVDFAFDREMFTLAAQLDGWRPQGAAVAVSHRPAWSRPAETMRFVLEAAERAARISPGDLGGWVEAAAVGLVRIAEEAEPAGRNLLLLFTSMIDARWLRPDQLPEVVKAVRRGARQVKGVPDPIGPALTSYYSRILRQVGNDHVAASEAFKSFVYMLPEADRLAAYRIILTRG